MNWDLLKKGFFAWSHKLTYCNWLLPEDLVYPNPNKTLESNVKFAARTRWWMYFIHDKSTDLFQAFASMHTLAEKSTDRLRVVILVFSKATSNVSLFVKGNKHIHLAHTLVFLCTLFRRMLNCTKMRMWLMEKKTLQRVTIKKREMDENLWWIHY